MSETKQGRSPKRGEWVAAKRLVPYLKPYVASVVLLFLVTLGYSGADAGRAALVMPLFNHILVRGTSATNDWRDDRMAARVTRPELSEAERNVLKDYPGPNDETERKVLLEEDCGLTAAVPRGAPLAAREDELGKLLARSRARIMEAVEQHVAKPRESGEKDDRKVNDLLKAIRLQRAAVALVSSNVLTARPEARDLAAALSMKARRDAGDAMFGDLWEDLLWIFVVAMGIAFALGTGHFLMFYLARALVTRIVIDIQNQLAEHLLTLSIRYFNTEKRGELFSRLTNELSNLQAVLMLLLSDVLIQPVRLLVLGTAAVFVSWQLSISLVVLAGTVIIPVRLMGKRIRRSARSRQVSVANVFEALSQMFAGIRIVKAFRRERFEMERFREKTQEFLVTSLKVVRDRTASKSWMEFVNDVTIPVVLLAGGALVIRHVWGLDVGRFGTFMGLVVLMYMPAKALAASYNTLQDALPSVDRVFEVLDLTSEIQDAPDAVPLGKLTRSIKFEDVSFGYVEGTLVLKNITFEAKAGEVTAIVGKTTAGKSTLVDLVARFYDPTSGKVTIDGVDLKKAKLASLLDKIAVVNQDPFLFNASVRENIRYGRLAATDAEVEAAAKAAKIHDDIMSKREGYAFNVGERGANVSGGQKQRLTIARAILKNPEILILDEATSALDSTTERQVQEALEELEHGRTTFVIAHRLSTIQHAHQILVLENGRIVERGRHDELVANGGVYTSFVRNLEMTRTDTGSLVKPVNGVASASAAPANGAGTHGAVPANGAVTSGAAPGASPTPTPVSATDPPGDPGPRG